MNKCLWFEIFTVATVFICESLAAAILFSVQRGGGTLLISSSQMKSTEKRLIVSVEEKNMLILC